MYNKYFTMKKSQLKEAIKAEIKSVLTEDFNDDNRGLAYIKSDGERDGFESFTQYAGKQNLKNVPDLEAYTDGFAKGVMQKGNKLVQLISRATVGGADAEPLMKMIGLKEDEDSLEEVYQTNSKMKQMVSLFQDMMADEYDGILVTDAFKDFIPKFFEAVNKDYESAENFGEKVSNIRENEDEAPVGDKKTEKAARGADKVKDDYAKIAGKDNTEISKASSLVKEKAKKAKEGDKEALNFLKSNQKVIKAYNDLKR